MKAPLRIPLGGGGTDLPSYADTHGGYCVSGTIDKYVHVLVQPSFDGRWKIKYSAYEEVEVPEAIMHPIIREALRGWDGPPLEIVTLADVPAGTGLGSSGAFTVALVKALGLARARWLTPREVAYRACAIEIDRLGYHVGRQDQYSAAIGGLNSYSFRGDDVYVAPMRISERSRSLLKRRLLAFFTGKTRSASAILADQANRANERKMLANLHETKKIGMRSKSLLEIDDLEGFAKLMDKHWRLKRSRSPGITTPEIDDAYAAAKRSGAIGGKLVGAGGGGYLVVYTNDPDKTRAVMAMRGLTEMVFDFQPRGCCGE